MDTIKAFFSSEGLKRKLASLLNGLIPIISSVPILLPFVTYIQWIAGLLGGVGVVHATTSGKLVENRSMVTISSVLGALALAMSGIPELIPYIVIVQAIAAVIGWLGFGATKIPSA